MNLQFITNVALAYNGEGLCVRAGEIRLNFAHERLARLTQNPSYVRCLNIHTMKKLVVGKLPKLTKEQTRVLDEIINGSVIELDENNDPYNYHLVSIDNTYEIIRADTVEKLRNTGLIKQKKTEWYEPKRWA